jgi:predicted small secreted protein
MKRRNITKILAVILIVLLMTQITACNKRRGVEKTVPEHVYRRTEIALPEKIQYVSNMFLEGERIYVLGVGYNETDYTEYYILYSMNQDGSDPVEKKMDVSFSKIDGYDGSYLSYITALSDQRLLAVVDAWAEDKEKGEYKSDNFFIILDKDGKVQKKINLNELLKNHITTDYFYAGMLLSDSAGNIYISSDRTIYVLKSDFTFSFKVELTGNSWMQSMFNYSKDRIAVVMSTEGEEGYKMQIRIIDPEKKAFSDEITVNTHLQNNLYELFTGLDYSLYYSTQSGI